MRAASPPCTKEYETAKLVEGLCAECRIALGLTAGPVPELRPAGPCQRCGYPEIVQCLMRERGATGGDHSDAHVRPLAVGFTPADIRTFWTNRKTGTEADLDAPIGVLVAYVCRRCGFTELFTDSPGAIPIGAEHGTRLLTGETPPYR